MGQEVLTPPQKVILQAVLSDANLANFYLSGGTALSAFYLHHRVSDDLDFFSFEKPDGVFIHAFAERLRDLLKTSSMRFERIFDRNLFFYGISGGRELKIEFTHYPFRQLDPPSNFTGLAVDSLRDVAANKLMAMLDRFEPKDFVDLYFLLQDRKLSEVWEDAQVKFGAKIDPLFLGGELAKARRVSALPKMLKPLTVHRLKNFFTQLARELAPDVLI